MRRIALLFLCTVLFMGCQSATSAPQAEPQGLGRAALDSQPVETQDLTPVKANQAENKAIHEVVLPDQHVVSQYVVDVDPATGAVEETRPLPPADTCFPKPAKARVNMWVIYALVFVGSALPHLWVKASWRTRVTRALLVAILMTLIAFTCLGCQLPGSTPAVKPPAAGGAVAPANQVVQKALDLPWLITSAILGIAGSIVGVLFLPGPGKTIALALAAFCAISLGLTILVAQYAQWVVIGTVVACVAVGVYALARARKAIPELVQTVELAKAKLSAEAKEHLFGNGNTLEKPGLVRDKVQSPGTEALVAAVRSQK